jgi:2-polyprenyl-6-methoxyphenol hydroxylase-like FAD-dependent oxidoreductase
MDSMNTQVLIVGAGPVGLALAIELGHRGIRCIVVERNDRVGHAPRAKTTNVRTREHMRRWGIAQQLREASPLGPDYPSNVLFVTRLSGYLLTRFDNAFYCAPGKSPLYSEHAQWIPQYTVEEVMRAHAESLAAVDIRFNQELQALEHHDGRVRARIHDLGTGTSYAIESQYLVGADGARSTVRQAIGARMHGTHRLSRHYNIIFRAPGLAHAHTHGPAIMYWQVNGEVPSVIGPMDRGDKWFFMPTAIGTDANLSDHEAVSLIRRATGIDLPYEILSSDQWIASRLVADRYGDGRVFLAGDACHLHPPFGGYGMNMGIADGVDLGWKLAAVLQGWGGSLLLDSYERERRPVHDYVMDEAVANHAILSNHLLAEGIEDPGEAGAQARREAAARIQAAKIREFNTLGVVLGYRYDDSPVIVGDGTPPPAQDFLNYMPCARPGCLAPHAWLQDGSSLYDHFGQGFTLLALDDPDAADIERASYTAREAGMPLKVLNPREPIIGDLYKARYVLIRPDQHVAWRGDAWPDDGERLLEQVTGGREVEYRRTQYSGDAR